jgi:hypothetical protein
MPALAYGGRYSRVAGVGHWKMTGVIDKLVEKSGIKKRKLKTSALNSVICFYLGQYCPSKVDLEATSKPIANFIAVLLSWKIYAGSGKLFADLSLHEPNALWEEAKIIAKTSNKEVLDWRFN